MTSLPVTVSSAVSTLPRPNPSPKKTVLCGASYRHAPIPSPVILSHIYPSLRNLTSSLCSVRFWRILTLRTRQQTTRALRFPLGSRNLCLPCLDPVLQMHDQRQTTRTNEVVRTQLLKPRSRRHNDFYGSTNSFTLSQNKFL